MINMRQLIKKDGESARLVPWKWVLGTLLVSIAVLNAACSPRSEYQTKVAQNCDVRSGWYFDFRTGICVSSSTSEDHYALSSYYLAGEVAKESPTAIYLFRIELLRDITPTELAKLLIDQRVQSVGKLKISFPKVDNGLTIIDPKEQSSSTAKTDAVKTTIEAVRTSLTDLEMVTTFAALAKAVSNKEYVVEELYLRLQASDISSWWVDNKEFISAATALDAPLPDSVTENALQ